MKFFSKSVISLCIGYLAGTGIDLHRIDIIIVSAITFGFYIVFINL
jgi:hypothetical protein